MGRSRGIGPKELFLSHSSLDRAFAVRLARDLRRHSIAVWYSETDILGAQQWHDEIGAALDRCDWFAVVLSPAAVSSRWVKRELLFALNEPRYDKHLVPLVYQACEHKYLSWSLAAFQMIDFTGNYTAGCRELLRIWGLGFKAGRK